VDEVTRDCTGSLPAPLALVVSVDSTAGILSKVGLLVSGPGFINPKTDFGFLLDSRAGMEP